MFELRCEIWIAAISEFTKHQAALDSVLTADEQAYVLSLRAGAATARLSRGLLRLLLARQLDLPPAEVEILRNCPNCGRLHGRPRLARPPAAKQGIEFSVSHGGDLLVLAFAGSAPVGVDVEPIGALDDADADLLDFTLTTAELRRLQETPAARHGQTFLRYWTGKEAVLKALGTGLDLEPQAVALSLSPTNGTASVTLPGSSPVHLWIRDVDVGPAHVCTLATGQEVRELRSARLSPSSILSRLP